MSFEVLLALPSVQKLALVRARGMTFATRSAAELFVARSAPPFGSQFAIVEGDRATVEALPEMVPTQTLLDDDSDLPPAGAPRPDYKFKVVARSLDGKREVPIAEDDSDFYFLEEAKAAACAAFINRYCAYANPGEHALYATFNASKPDDLRAVVAPVAP